MLLRIAAKVKENRLLIASPPACAESMWGS
jgi:hypothetical protein